MFWCTSSNLKNRTGFVDMEKVRSWPLIFRDEHTVVRIIGQPFCYTAIIYPCDAKKKEYARVLRVQSNFDIMGKTYISRRRRHDRTAMQFE